MRSFPDNIISSNLKDFSTLLFNENLSKLRSEVYYFILSLNENEETNSFFDLQSFSTKCNVNKEHLNVMIASIISELEELNWNCELGFGGTGLFIWSKKKPYLLMCSKEI